MCWLLPGRCAALNMLGRGEELHTVPYFWSTLLGKSIRYAGREGHRGEQSNSFPSAGSGGGCRSIQALEWLPW